MDIKSFFKKDYTIGLDIGSSSVKSAVFSRTDAGIKLVRAELKEIAKTGDAAADEKATVSAISYLLKGINLRKAKVIVTINCPHTAIKKVIAPYMPKAELLNGIRMEAKHYFPFPIEESMVDFEIVGDIVDKGVRKYELIVAVSPKATVERYLSLLEKAQVRPSSFLPSGCALYESATAAARPDEVRCLIDIGCAHSELVICKGKDLLFTRKLPVAGGDFTTAMTGVLISDRGRIQLAKEEAEKIKRETGIPSGAGSDLIDDKISSDQVMSMLREPLEHLAREIERCFDFYREESGGGRVEEVLLFGGGASLGGLTKFLSAELGVEVRLGDPLEGLDAAKDAVRDGARISHRLEQALSAALGGTGGVNLLPPEIKEEMKRVVARGTLEVVGVSIVVVAALIFVGMKIRLGNLEKRISVAGLELSSLRLQLRKAEANALAHRVLVDEPQWEDIFTELGNLLPPNVHLTNLKIMNNAIYLKGVVASADGEQVLANLILTLEKGLFRNVKLVASRQIEGQTGIEFELKCWIDYENS